MSVRDAKLDSVKGVLIILVVLGHYIEISAPGGVVDVPAGWRATPHQLLLFTIYAFHMPLFVFFAGTTAKAQSAGLRAVQLIALYVPMQVVVLMATDSFEIGRMPNPAFALWFLTALVAWLVATPLIDRFPRQMLLLSVAIALLGALLPGPTSQLGISRTLFYFPFFVAGHLFGWRVLQASKTIRPLTRAAAVVLLMLVAAVFSTVDIYPRWIMGTGTMDSAGVDAPEAVFSRLAVLVLMVLASAALLALIPGSSPKLAVLGRRSITVYLFHQLPVVLVAKIVPFSISPWLGLATSLALTAVTVWILGTGRLHEAVTRYQQTIARALGLR